ncbi:4'-phosphopantetheinyl transferase superfamily protein [Streptomyces sp. NPDC090499]|uniref:4'-phosphopantetheinyl transferase superfamily protein n=1 Tax=Streptomyces sp. NPDC090499 TaxID=3365965 RepID=UPI0038070D3D
MVPGARGVGVDLETALPDRRTARILLTEQERIELWPAGDLATLRFLFTVKEAGFKALSDCRAAHGGLFWRVRLLSRDGRLWARAGHAQAGITGGVHRWGAFALAVRTGEDEIHQKQ